MDHPKRFVRSPLAPLLSVLLAVGALLAIAAPASARVGVNVGFYYCKGPTAATRFVEATPPNYYSNINDVAAQYCNPGTVGYGTQQSVGVTINGNVVATGPANTDFNNSQVQFQLDPGSYQLGSNRGAGTETLTVEQNSYSPAGIGLLIVTYEAAPVDTNHPPVLSGPSTLSATEDTDATTSAYSATDQDNDTVSYSVSDPPHGTASINASHVVTYRGDANYNGSDSFTVTVSDGRGGSDSQAVSVTVAAVNDPPSAISGSQSVSEDTPTSVTLQSADVDGPSLTYAIVTPPSHGTLSGTGATRTYTPSPNYNGPDSVTFTVSDGTSTSNTATLSITVTAVNDAPVIDDATVPENQTYEATSSAGAVATFTSPTATDVDGDTVTVTCAPASGSTFGLGATTVTCSATDAAQASDSATFTVTVEDTTAPVIDTDSIPGEPIVVADQTVNVLTVDATGPLTTVTFGPVTATDTVDGTIDADCTPASGTEFAIGDTEVTCTATDAADNESDEATFIVRVVDVTAPVVAQPSSITAEATGPNGATVTFDAPAASDDVDGSLTSTCVPPSGSTFAITTTTVTCSATDAADNTGQSTFQVTVQDTTAPVITLTGGVQDGQTYQRRNVPAAPTCSATDIVDGSVPCTVSGYDASTGTHTITVRATDAAGNTAERLVTYTVAIDVVAPTATPRPPAPTATPRATPRPRLNPTETPVPAEPTTRPTPRPRG